MISDFVYILRGRLPGLLGLLGLGATSAFLLAFVDPIAMKLLIDEGLGRKNLKLFIVVCVVVVSVAALLSVLKFCEALWAQRLKNDLAGKLCERMLAVFYRLPYRQVSAEGEGYFISRVYEEPRKAVDLVVGLVQQTLTRLITIITALGISLYLSWRVTVVLAVTVPLLYWLSRKFSGRITRESKLENEAEASFRHGLARGLGAYVTVRSFGLESPMTHGAMFTLNGFFLRFISA